MSDLVERGQQIITRVQIEALYRERAALESRLSILTDELNLSDQDAATAQAMARAAEARIAALETDAATTAEALHVLRIRNGNLDNERRHVSERLAALEAAARACVDTMTHWKDGTLVWCCACDTDEASRGHQASCQLGVLAALLDGAA